jgi:hypothetical protein
MRLHAAPHLRPVTTAAWLLVLAVGRSAAQAPTAESCWKAIEGSELYVVGSACLSVWADSLRSTVRVNRWRAGEALASLGGRAAVDALRREFEQSGSRESQLPLIWAMGTTGSPDDIAFLVSQLTGPFVGNADRWPATQEAATTLGLLRATSSREALRALLAKYGQSGFAGRAVAAALAALDRPPCADSVRGELRRELARIVMECGPQSMWTTQRYADRSSGGVWSFSGGSWRFRPGLSDAVAKSLPGVSSTVAVAADNLHASVTVSTWCGNLCGEGWTFRLVSDGAVWRVVNAVMEWVS